ncbi:MAG: cation:proton antiporter [Rikenellaceae bacterium]|jgi:Kef-type K+ transport system membrane component KefB|nr:cation:proton antiporter [Rikenellaceae bacterium]
MLALARMLGEVFERFRQPSMVGEIIAGIILGPTLLGWVGYTSDIRAISDLAVLMLIIHAGLEIKVDDIREAVSGKKLWIAIFGFCIPFASGLLLGWLWGFDSLISIFLGLCISITALPVSVRILIDLGKLNSEVGRNILSAAIFNDVAALLVLGVVLNFNDTTGEATIGMMMGQIGLTLLKILVFLAILLVTYRLFTYLTHRFINRRYLVSRYFDFLRGKESTFAVVMIFILLFASLAELIGLHFIIGAFFGAILVPQELISNERMQGVISSTSTITMGFLAPIFFAGIGLEFNLLAITDFWLMGAVLLVSFVSKIAGGYASGRIAGYSSAKSATLGIGLNARGIIELVIANIALSNGLIDISFFSILVLMGLVTTLVTPVLLNQGFKMLDRRGESS